LLNTTVLRKVGDSRILLERENLAEARNLSLGVRENVTLLDKLFVLLHRLDAETDSLLDSLLVLLNHVVLLKDNEPEKTLDFDRPRE
jgi:hypothetical protein